MSKKKEKGMLFNNLEVATNAKAHFLSLCKMYEHMGKLFAVQSKAMTHPKFKQTPVPQTHCRVLEQYKEMGEEMISIGTYLDFMPGKRVLRPEEPEAKKVSIEVEKTFVSNIKPLKKEEEKEKL